MVQKFLAAAVTAAALVVAACSGSQSVDKASRVAPPDPTWVTSISQHSSGAISRHSPVRVYFTTDVVPEALVGKDAAANITISPAVKTKATFASRREIVLRPETQFAPATNYKVSVAAKGLIGVPPGTKPFEFVITTLGVNFDVRMHGLDVAHDRNELMTLRGSVQTADREDRELVEKIVTATLDGEPVKLVWETGGDTQYSFAVREILRKKEEQELVVRWDGAPLKLEQTGSQSWRVPALD